MEEKWGFDPYRFATLENLASLSIHRKSLYKHRQAGFYVEVGPSMRSCERICNALV